jgi:hypothetical protein
LASEANHAGALRPGCSHSVHFLLRQRCSSASPWLFRRHEEWIVDVTNGRGGDPGSLIPCGNELLNPGSSVLIVPNCFHHTETAEIAGAFAHLRRRGGCPLGTVRSGDLDSWAGQDRTIPDRTTEGTG